MNVKEIIVYINEYSGSCFICQRIVDIPVYYEDYIIKVCSLSCLKKYREIILNQYPNSMLKLFWIFAFNNSNFPEKRSQVIEALSKYFARFENGYTKTA